MGLQGIASNYNDADLVSSNVRKNTNIFGVVGNVSESLVNPASPTLDGTIDYAQVKYIFDQTLTPTLFAQGELPENITTECTR